MISINNDGDGKAGVDPRFPTVDYVLVHSASHIDMATPRELFEDEMRRDGLEITKETIGHRVFLKIKCPFKRLAHEAERIKLEMPIKGCEIKPQEPSCFRWLSKKLSTDDEVDFVTAPFECDKLPLYEGYEDQETFFRQALRSYLTHNIMINLDIKDYLKGHNPDEQEDIVSRRGLLYLLMKNAYTDCFVLHEPSAEEPYYLRIKETSLQEYYLQIPKTKFDLRREMQHTWVTFWKFQPLWKIRNYFGEQIAFYFAWVGTFLTCLWIPALLGFCIFAYGMHVSIQKSQSPSCVVSLANLTDHTGPPIFVCNSVEHLTQLGKGALSILRSSFDNNLTPFFSLIICLWGTFFLEIWKRNNYTLAYQWDVDGYEHAEPDRPEFFGTKQRPDPITGELAWFYPISKRFSKFFVSAVVSSLMILAVFGSVSGVIAYKVLMRVQFNCSADGDSTMEIGEENKGNPMTCLALTTVVPTVLNAVSILILGQIYQRLAEKLTFWENHRTQSEFNDSLIIKLFAFQFANTYASLFYIAFFRPLDHGFQMNGVFGWGERYRDTCTGGTCMSLLSFQVLVLMIIKPFPKFFKDVVIPWLRRRWRRLRHMARKDKVVEDLPENRPDTADSGAAAREEATLTTNNFLEREFYKPPLGDFTLGEYTEKVIQFGYIVMFASSFALAPLLALIINLFDLRVDAKRLLWWNRRPVAFLASHIGMWFPILRFVNFCGVVSNAFLVGYTSSFCADFFESQGMTCTPDKRLAIVVVFEHLVFLSMYLINVIIPDIPASVKLAQRREKYQVIKIMEEGGHKVRKAKRKQQKEEKKASRRQSKKNLENRDKDIRDHQLFIKENEEGNSKPNTNNLRPWKNSLIDSEKQFLILQDELERANTEELIKREIQQEQSSNDIKPSQMNEEDTRSNGSKRSAKTFATETTDIPLEEIV